MTMTIADWTFYCATEAAKWLNTAVYLVGLGIALWAFLRSRKRAYLAVALFFGLVLVEWHVWPPISHAIYVHRTPVTIQQKNNADFQQAVDDVVAKAGHPVSTYRTNIQIAPMVLVFGLWLLARLEPERHRPNKPAAAIPAASALLPS